MNLNKDCPKQFATVSNILGVICAINFAFSVVLASNTQPMVVFWFYNLPRSVSVMILAAILFAMIYMSVIINKPVVWSAFGLLLIVALAGWAYGFFHWEGRLILLAVYGVLFYIVYMLRECRIWAAFIFMFLVGLDLLYSVYDCIFEANGIPLTSLIIDPICLYLLIKGYLEYRKDSHIEVPPTDDGLAVPEG